MIFFYVLVFYTLLDKSGKTIFDQVDSNNYNSSMLYMLTIQLVFMIVDRYIYKSKSFVDKEDMVLKIDKPWEDINNQITKHKMAKIKKNGENNKAGNGVNIQTDMSYTQKASIKGSIKSISILSNRFKASKTIGGDAKTLTQSKAYVGLNKTEEIDLGNTDKLFA